jgi:hypothetical protein
MSRILLLGYDAETAGRYCAFLSKRVQPSIGE